MNSDSSLQVQQTIASWGRGVSLSFLVWAAAFSLLSCGPRSAGRGPPTPPPVDPAPAIPAGPYTPGQSYFGRNQYIEYIAGNAPVIFTAPHGGGLTPEEIPPRGCGTTVTDRNTDDVARKVSAVFYARTGRYPHVVINRLARSRLDANRDIVEATCTNAAAAAAWEEWHGFIEIAKTASVAAAGRGWYVDLHGHGHPIQRLELGYLLNAPTFDLTDAEIDAQAALETSSSLRTLSRDDTTTSFAQLLRGPHSLGSLFAAEGFPAVPSASDPTPAGAQYFAGGYNTDRHGCARGGPVCGLQIEANLAGVRDTEENRLRFAVAIVKVMTAFLRDRWGLAI